MGDRHRGQALTCLQQVLGGAIAAIFVLAAWPGHVDAARPVPTLSASCTPGAIASASWDGARVDTVQFNYLKFGGTLAGEARISSKADRSGSVAMVDTVPADVTTATVSFQIHRGPNVEIVGSLRIACG